MLVQTRRGLEVVSRWRHERPSFVDMNVPDWLETTQCAGSAGLTAMSSGGDADGASRAANVRPPSWLTWIEPSSGNANSRPEWTSSSW